MNVLGRPTGRPHCKATNKDVRDAPRHMVAEVLAGTLHAPPRSAMRHAWASSILGGELVAPFARGRGGWRIVDEPELRLGDDIVEPKLAG